MGALRDFVADVAELEGAAVEPVEPDGLEVMAPPALAGAMGWPELARLGFGAELPRDAIAIGLEGDWLDRFGALFGERGRFAERQLVVADGVAPPSDPERLIDRGTMCADECALSRRKRGASQRNLSEKRQGAF